MHLSAVFRRCGAALKSLLLLLASLAAATGVFISGVAVAAYVMSDPEPHRFANMDTPDLWTSSPVPVDTGQQDYQRIDAAPAVASLPAVHVTQNKLADAKAHTISMTGQETAEIDNLSTGALSGHDAPRTASLDPAHADWCFTRYRSYRIEDDSYQPYGGGPRVQCQSPWTPMPEDVQAVGNGDNETMPLSGDPYSTGVINDDADINGIEQVSARNDRASPAGAHEEWCVARYRSYRVEDNSYQPFGMQSRKPCHSPYG